MSPNEYRAALKQRLAARQEAVAVLHRRIDHLHVEIGVEKSAVTEITWALEQLGDETPAAVANHPDPAPARAPRGDVQGIVLDVIRANPGIEAAQIAAKVQRKASQVNRTILALIKASKIVPQASGYFAAPHLPMGESAAA